ncbi:dioxygenase family protein [Sphingomonas fuzhouensis]|uniref:dioxygenase family protein n=1 Tax=Sphingomonas fuzhouensis TaxID=3106033 RepID=UPI002AFE3591|nr:dioxygenase [Sphingomonas sp. SGZ-02]
MHVVTPSEITEAVIRSFGGTPDPRTKAIVTALTRHLHAFVMEVRPSTEEWSAAIGFLKRTGDTPHGARQELILLSDVLGVSMLVDAINHSEDEAATESTVLGPFFVEDTPVLPLGADMSGGAQGKPLWIDIAVTDAAGSPLAGAMVDIWQADDDGVYDVQRDLPDGAHINRGRFQSDDKGRVRCWSVIPASYQIPSDGPAGEVLAATGRHAWRPAHVHFRIAAEGYRPLVTHLFVRGDAYLGSDAVFGVKPSLVADLSVHRAPAPDGRAVQGAWRSLDYRFVLQRGDR